MYAASQVDSRVGSGGAIPDESTDDVPFGSWNVATNSTNAEEEEEADDTVSLYEDEHNNDGPTETNDVEGLRKEPSSSSGRRPM